MKLTMKDLYELLTKAWGEQPTDYHAYSLIDVVREAAGIKPPKGWWWDNCSDEERKRTKSLINYFVDVVKLPGPEYDEHGKTHCRLCDGWNGLHQSCPAANAPNETFGYEECELKLMRLISEEPTQTGEEE